MLESRSWNAGSPPRRRATPREVFENTTAFFVANGFVDFEVVSWTDGLIRGRGHHLLGLRAYQRIVAAGGQTFISLEQVVSNLLDNAIKYGEGRPITVDVTAKDGRGHLVVRDRASAFRPKR